MAATGGFKQNPKLIKVSEITLSDSRDFLLIIQKNCAESQEDNQSLFFSETLSENRDAYQKWQNNHADILHREEYNAV